MPSITRINKKKVAHGMKNDNVSLIGADILREDFSMDRLLRVTFQAIAVATVIAISAIARATARPLANDGSTPCSTAANHVTTTASTGDGAVASAVSCSTPNVSSSTPNNGVVPYLNSMMSNWDSWVFGVALLIDKLSFLISKLVHLANKLA